MNTETSIQVRRQRRTTRKTQQVFSELQTLQQEVQILRSQIARLEEAANTRQTTESRVPQSLGELRPRQQPAPGKTAMQMIQGQWPGEETTEELLAQLKALK